MIIKKKGKKGKTQREESHKAWIRKCPYKETRSKTCETISFFRKVNLIYFVLIVLSSCRYVLSFLRSFVRGIVNITDKDLHALQTSQGSSIVIAKEKNGGKPCGFPLLYFTACYSLRMTFLTKLQTIFSFAWITLISLLLSVLLCKYLSLFFCIKHWLRIFWWHSRNLFCLFGGLLIT